MMACGNQSRALNAGVMGRAAFIFAVRSTAQLGCECSFDIFVLGGRGVFVVLYQGAVGCEGVSAPESCDLFPRRVRSTERELRVG